MIKIPYAIEIFWSKRFKKQKASLMEDEKELNRNLLLTVELECKTLAIIKNIKLK